MLSAEQMQCYSPKEARFSYRQGNHSSTSTYGLFSGYFQANIAVIEEEYADDFRQFCDMNQSACPVIYQSKPGEYTNDFLSSDSDIRSDLPSYKVFKDGSHFETVNDLKKFTWGKMVTFYLGCSFSFDDKLAESGIKLETTENVSMYLSNVKCHKVAKFQTRMVVSMRPIPKSLVQKVYEATINLEYCHGAPVHFGYPKDIGIDIQKDIDFGSKVEIPKGHVPVFWACGVTSSEAIKSARLPICFSHAPGCMYVSDTRSDDLSGKLNFKTYPEPKVVCLNDKLAKYSVISEYTWNLLNELEEEIFEDAGNRGISDLLVKEDFNKAVLSLSKHCYSVAILLGFPCFHDKQPFEENDGIAGAILIARALTKLGTKVTFFIDKNSHILKKFLENCFGKHFSSSFTAVRNIDCDSTITSVLYHEDLSTPYFTHLIAIERPSRAADGNYYSMSAKNISSRCDHLDLLFNEAKHSPDITTIGIGDGGNETGMGKVHDKIVKTVPNGEVIASVISCNYLITAGVSDWAGYAIAAGLFITRQCPVHDRFRTFGIKSDEEIPSFVELFLNDELDFKLRQEIRDNGFRDGVTGNLSLTVDGLSYENVHQPKIQKLRDIAKSVINA